VTTSFQTPRQSGGRGKWDCGNNSLGNESSGNGSSGKKFPGTGNTDKFPGNGFDNQPGKRPPCLELPGNKPPGTGFSGNKFSGTGSSGNRPPGNRPPRNEVPGNIQDGKREALQLCKGHIGSSEQRGAVLNGSKSDAGRGKQTFVFGGNLTTVPTTSEKWTHVKPPANQAQPEHIKEIPDLAKALQTAVKETMSDYRLHTTTNFKAGLDATILNPEAMSRRGGGEQQEERMKQLEQRVGDLEQQLAEEKVEKETLLASVERALVGEAMEETCSELKLVRLIHDIKAKIMRREQGEQVVPLDLNGNETPAEGDAAAKYCRSESSNSGRILHAKVGTKARPGEATSMAKQYPANFLPRALALGTGNKGHKGDLRNIRHQKQGGPVVRGDSPTVVSMEEKMMGQNKLSSKSAQSLSCHLRSPDGRMLA